ncbi:hypothetical protein [Candidatus Poriferisodalis sp.]|uniref:hypothetical protein n=1 Tax=Candidatus Poriferisodalis sp. TaxID=3101277 RepID=UPI003B01CFAE
MTLTASLPTKALASVLAALLLSTTMAVAMPTRADLPGVLDALDISPAAAHTDYDCTYYTVTVYPNGRNGPGAYQETRERCVTIPHSHWWERAVYWGGTTLLCGTFGVAVGGATAGVGGAVASGACFGTIATLPGP